MVIRCEIIWWLLSSLNLLHLEVSRGSLHDNATIGGPTLLTPLPLPTEFLRKLGKAPSSLDPSTLAKTLRDPEIIDATFRELSKYHVGKLNG